MKKQSILTLLLCLFAVSIFNSCETEVNEDSENARKAVPTEILAKLANESFDITNAHITTMFGEEGVRVEDLFLTYEQIEELQTTHPTRQYHTNNLVKKLPRVITIAVDPDLGTLGSDALDDAIAMYNNIGSQLTFQRVAFGLKGKNKAKIEVTAFSEQPSGGFITLGIAAGFP